MSPATVSYLSIGASHTHPAHKQIRPVADKRRNGSVSIRRPERYGQKG